METTSLSLLRRLAESGEGEDWQTLLLIYKPFIQKVVMSYPALASQAEDITQEVMLILLRELPAFQRQRTGSFRAWLRNITVNQMRSSLRKSKRYHQASAEVKNALEQVESLADPQSVAAKKWDEEHDRTVMQKVIDLVRPTIQPQTWLAFERYAIADIPPAQVAEELGLSLNSVLLAKSRVLKRLREEAKGLVDD